MLAADTADTADAVLLSKYVSGMCVPNVVKNTEVVIKNGEVASPTAIGDCVCKDLTQSSTADLKCNTITDFANYFKFNTDTCYTVGYATLLTTDFMKDTGQVMKLISL